ncbi:uncharacterized protein SPSK_03343 [Sporothrix schenckii 1099-18]|uniref:Glycosyl transferase family 8 protein n=2 Tax=Sporothrix schenckii TaxID=29908 RepID=U7PT24_SPOS1|nr:uncharacterized protein SPSK_03343 [Sporothrix schenckii 1099-18]ERS97615.1 hypothetical protein HMPREF1624_05786 [Sporothrix schenckii ATCC 58251]KJR82137.1 hypothetical protein SPSK_03343 [Sporothrix schenckii 1099-18]
MLIGLSPRRRFAVISIFSFVVLLALFSRTEMGVTALDTVKEKLPLPPMRSGQGQGKEEKEKPRPHPKYKPLPSDNNGYVPPPVREPFPLLANSDASTLPPPIPEWNRPRPNLHTEYGLATPPPLLIGFTRSWPMLLQAVVSYITAGWPAEQIYVVENTGVQQANTRGQLTLQHPFYLNHTTLRRLGVNVVQTPVLLTFAQLQNFYLSLTYARGWTYYFWSHMDVLTLSYEEGLDGVTPPYSDKGVNGKAGSGYKTVYELCCQALQGTLLDDPHWGLRFFAYDHLALVNPAAYEAVGGWDTLIPYYMTDCDMHARLGMANWTIEDRRAGIVTDVNTVLADLAVLYRVDGLPDPDFVDPNPRPQTAEEKKIHGRDDEAAAPAPPADTRLDQWRKLRDVSDRMFQYKHGDRERNTWQAGQTGGQGEKFYYPAQGIAEGIDVLTEAGREVYRRKWGHRDCDLVDGAGLSLWDQWLVEKDW